MLKKVLEKIKNCPVCGNKKFKINTNPYKNVYSDIISHDLKINETDLINKFINVQCTKCKLVYKHKWFSNNYLNKIFNKLIPIHPKGWDKYSKKFSKKNLKSKINFLLKSFNNLNSQKKNKLKREIISICDSIDEEKLSYRQTKFKKQFIINIKNDKISKIKNNYKEIIKLVNQPEKYKRFAGFGNIEVINYFKKFSNKLRYYSELGCPLWGNFHLLKNKSQKMFFIKSNSTTFWGKKCERNKIKCCKYLKLKNLEITNINSLLKKKLKINFMMCSLVLDHLKKPVTLVKLINKVSSAYAFILEDYSKGVPLQHFTGWNNNSMKYLANMMNKKLDTSFVKIRKSGYRIFVFY